MTDVERGLGVTIREYVWMRRVEGRADGGPVLRPVREDRVGVGGLQLRAERWEQGRGWGEVRKG